MTRLVLLMALVAVGYDAYAFQGYYTRAAVGQVETGLQGLSAKIGETRTNEIRMGDSPATKPAAP